MKLKEAGLTPGTTAAAKKLLAKAQARGIGFILTSGKRTRAKQQALWDDRASNRYPVARPGTSEHERGTAFDGVAVPRGRQAELAQLWLDMGGQWSHRDAVHFSWRKGA